MLGLHVVVCAEAPVRKLALGGGGDSHHHHSTGEDLVSTTMPHLNHIVENSAVRIQSLARGRKTKKAFGAKRRAAVRMQSVVRRSVTVLVYG